MPGVRASTSSSLSREGFLVEKKFIKEENRFEYTSIQRFDYKPCTEYKSKNTYKTLFDTSISTRIEGLTICPDLEDDPEKAELVSSSDLSSKTLYIRVYPCSLPDPSQCSPGYNPDFSTASMVNIEWTPQSGNYTDPLQTGMLSQNVDINSKAKRTVTLQIRRHRIVDVLNEFQGEELREEYLVSTQTKVDETSRDSSHTHCSESDMTFFSKTCDEYFTIHHNALSEVITLRRNYKKLSELSGEFGGILKIASVLFIFYVVYNAKAKEWMLANEVFGYKKATISQISPKREVDDLVGEKSQEQNLNASDNQIQKIAKRAVRETLNVNNFIQKLNFAELLQVMLSKGQNEELINLINLKRQLPNPKNKASAKDDDPQPQKERVIEHQLKALLNNYLVNQTGGSNNKNNQLQRQQQGKGKINNAKSIFIDENEPEALKIKKRARRKKLELESEKLGEPQQNTENKSLWTISENNNQQERMILRRDSPVSISCPKRKFKRGIKPLTIRVRQNSVKPSSSNALEKNNNMQQ